MRNAAQNAHIHAAGWDLKGGLQLPQTAALQILADELLRYAGHAEANGGQIHQQAAGAQLDLRIQPQTVLQEVLFQIQTGAGLALQQDQRKIRDLGQGIDMAEVAGILRTRHKNRMGGEAGDGFEAALTGSAGEGNVHLAGLQQTQHLVAAAGDDLDMNGGILAVEAVQIGQQELAGDSV